MAVALATAPAIAGAVEAPGPEPVESIVEQLIALMRENYVVEDRLEAIERRLRQGISEGRFPGPADPSAVSGGNWEGTGVEPEHQVPAGEALAFGYRQALEGLLAAADDRGDRARLEAILESRPAGDP